ncbi:MAG TPA: hypothetical protein VFE22_08300, partial [Edaphobacter sp.]|nr:hypothetical protein [Edaphobacter sp.]
MKSRQSSGPTMTRRNLLSGLAAGVLAASTPAAFAMQGAAGGAGAPRSHGPLRIADLELVELTGHYKAEAGVNGQRQVNPLDIYDALRPEVYRDRPDGAREV